MNNELKIKFFETFNIPEKCNMGRMTCKQYRRKCGNCIYSGWPDITNYQYLELIYLLSKVHRQPVTYNREFTNSEEVKENILTNCIDAHSFVEAEPFIEQVRQLFEGDQ